MFGLGWTPCIEAHLAAVLGLAAVGGGGAPRRGALLLFAYSIGLGLPFLIAALGFRRASGGSRPAQAASGCSNWSGAGCWS